MYIDLHCHILYDTDDGPIDKNEMLRMLDASYNDGVREICVTPHFNHSFYGDNKKSADRAFDDLKELARSKYPDMKLYRGSEIFYHFSCPDHLKSGSCHTMNGTKYVLVDFSWDESKFNVISALKKLISIGYIPILAHTERYFDLKPFGPYYSFLKDIGVLIQVNAGSIIGRNGFLQKWKANYLIKHKLCDIVASDAHNTTNRSTCINEAARLIDSKYGNNTSYILTHKNPRDILDGKYIVNQ